MLEQIEGPAASIYIIATGIGEICCKCLKVVGLTHYAAECTTNCQRKLYRANSVNEFECRTCQETFKTEQEMRDHCKGHTFIQHIFSGTAIAAGYQPGERLFERKNPPLEPWRSWYNTFARVIDAKTSIDPKKLNNWMKIEVLSRFKDILQTTTNSKFETISFNAGTLVTNLFGDAFTKYSSRGKAFDTQILVDKIFEAKEMDDKA